jgi:PX domain
MTHMFLVQSNQVCSVAGEVQKLDDYSPLFVDVGESLCGVVLSAKITAVRVLREADLLQSNQSGPLGEAGCAAVEEITTRKRLFMPVSRPRSLSKIGLGGDSDPRVAVYSISVETYHCQYQIVKRFSEFYSLKETIDSLLRNTDVPNLQSTLDIFPPKTLFSKLEPEFLENRRVQLQAYLEAVLKIDSCTAALSRFLEAEKYSELRYSHFVNTGK